MNEIIFLPPARKYLKKIKDKKLKKIFQDTLEAIRNAPTIGQVKTGDSTVLNIRVQIIELLTKFPSTKMEH